jgi:hypothetical protein
MMAADLGKGTGGAGRVLKTLLLARHGCIVRNDQQLGLVTKIGLRSHQQRFCWQRTVVSLKALQVVPSYWAGNLQTSSQKDRVMKRLIPSVSDTSLQS